MRTYRLFCLTMLMFCLAIAIPNRCSGQTKTSHEKLQKLFDSQRNIVIEYKTEIQKLKKCAENWSFDKRGASFVFIHQDGRWHLAEKWIGIERVSQQKFGYFFEVAPMGDGQRLDIQAKRVGVDETEFDVAVEHKLGVFEEEYRTAEDGLSVQIQKLNKDNNVIGEYFPLLFGKLFDEKPLAKIVEEAKVTSSRQIEFLGLACDQFEFQNESGFFQIICCPEMDYAPLKVEIKKNTEHKFRDGILGDIEGVASLHKTYRYLKLGERPEFETLFSTKYDDGQQAGTKVVTSYVKRERKIVEEDLKILFPIPNGQEVFRKDEPQVISQWQNGEVIVEPQQKFHR